MAHQIHGSGKQGPFIDLATAKAHVKTAVQTLFDRDWKLLLIDVHERTLAHKFAEYLTPLFPEFDVDCEYNRDGHAMEEGEKSPTKLAYLFQEKGIQRVYPDVIVHKRCRAVNARWLN